MINIIKSSDITVVIPHYNQSQYLEAALISVYEQTEGVGEVIVVDDCSAKEHYSVVEELCKKWTFKLVQLEANTGTPAGPRNYGARAARGKWVAFLDADDVWYRKKIEYQIKVINDLGREVVVSTSLSDFHDFDKNLFGGVEAGFGRSTLPVVKVTLLDQLVKYRTPTSSLLIPRSWILQSPFNEARSLRGREDVINSWLMHEMYGDSLKIKSPLIAYRRHPSQISKEKLRMFRVQMYQMFRFLSTRNPRLIALMMCGYFTFSNALLSVYREFRGRL